MSEQIIDVLDSICEKFGIAVDWTQENILPYVHELCGKYIRYEIATSITWCLVFFSLMAISFIVTSKFHKKAMSLTHPYDEESNVSWIAMTAWIFAVVLAFTAMIVAICQVFDIVTCLTFPEKMILEFANTLLK